MNKGSERTLVMYIISLTVLTRILSVGVLYRRNQETHLRSELSGEELEDDAKTCGLKADMLSVPDRG